MKKETVLFLILSVIPLIILCPNMAMGIGTAAVEDFPFIQELINESTADPETITNPESSAAVENREETAPNRGFPGLTETTNSPQSNQVRPRTQPATTGIADPAADEIETPTDNIILDSLPELPSSENPDTLSKIISWWSANPLEMKWWYLFLMLSALFFLYRQTSFRKPLLFACLVIFGFYFKNNVNPINSIFSIPVQTGAKLIDSIIVVALPIAISLIAGRFFCGWACPVGAVQEFIHPEKFALQPPPLLDKILSYIRYFLLIGIFFYSWSALANTWNDLDPFHSLFTFKWSTIPAILLLLVLTASILVERFYCRYLCPLGAVLAITSKFSLLKLKADSEVCIACGKCSQPKACPMEVVSAANPYTDLPHIKASECIVCYRCGDICRYSALKLSMNKRKKRTKDQNSENALAT